MTTINADGNGLSGATGSGSFVGSNSPLITTPKIGQIDDISGNASIVITATINAVNYLALTNAATLNAPTYGVDGLDANISTILASKGTGQIALFTGALTQPLTIFSGTSSQHATNFIMANTAFNRNVTFPDADGTILFAAGAGGLKSYQILTSGTAATYTRPAGITSILVEAVGGGGGGGGSQGGITAIGVGGGGGAGGYARLYVASASSTYTYTIGGGGGGGTAGITTGTSGGATTFSASSLSASGGIGGTGGASVSTTVSQLGGRGGIGGGGTNGDINMSGGYGGYGIANLTNGSSGGGGRSFYAPGAAPSAAQGTGNTASGHGGGGGGGLSTTTDQAGGPGSDGFIVVWEFS